MPSVDIFVHDPAATRFAAGDTLFSEGDGGDTMFVVLDGEIELSIRGKALDTLGPGQIFGEMALVDSGPRSATAIARKPSVVVPIDKRRFLYLVTNTPNFALEVMQTMSERLRRMDAIDRT